jgi:hypothetical protein
MQRNRRVVCSLLCALALAAFLAGCHHRKYGVRTAASRGVDVFQTSSAPGQGTGVDFAANPIPANFFCPGSPPFNGQIALVGKPLTTSPGGVAGNSDTIVERLKDVSFDGGSATIPVKVRALSLTSSSPLSINCTSGPSNWDVDVCVCGDQPTTSIVARVDQPCGCGHFDGTLRLATCLRFTNKADGRVVGPIKQPVDLTIQGMPWCPKPMANAVVINGPFTVTSCDGQVSLPGTSDFFPGPTCAEENENCFVKFASLTHCHKGPSPTHQHCVNPVCGERHQ